MNNIVEEAKTEPNKVQPESKPNEHSGFYFSSHLRITDPNTKEVLVQQRGDN